METQLLTCLIWLEKVDRLVDVLLGSIGLATVIELVDELMINQQNLYNDVDLCQVMQDSEKVSYQSRVKRNFWKKVC